MGNFVQLNEEWGDPDSIDYHDAWGVAGGSWEMIKVEGKWFIVCRAKGGVWVIDGRCPIDNQGFWRGDFHHDDGEVQCACGARFSYKTGKALKKADRDLPIYEHKEAGGKLFADLSIPKEIGGDHPDKAPVKHDWGAELMTAVWPQIDAAFPVDEAGKRQNFIREQLSLLKKFGSDLESLAGIHEDTRACVEELLKKEAEREPCQACENAPYTKVDGGENDWYPYKLCKACYEKLHIYTFRPHEWYNLARKFGCFQYSIGDKNYALDNGTSHEEFGRVDPNGAKPMPAFEDVHKDPDLLMDYTFTQWWYPEDSPETLAWKAAWQRFEAEDVLKALKKGIVKARSEHMVRCVGDVCRMTMPDAAAELYRHAWKAFPEAEVDLETLKELSDNVLPKDELVNLMYGALNNLRKQQK